MDGKVNVKCSKSGKSFAQAFLNSSVLITSAVCSYVSRTVVGCVIWDASISFLFLLFLGEKNEMPTLDEVVIAYFGSDEALVSISSLSREILSERFDVSQLKAPRCPAYLTESFVLLKNGTTVPNGRGSDLSS